MSTAIHDLHVQALAVVAGLDAAMLVAPVVGVLVSNDKHVSRLRILRRDAQRMLELTGGEGGLEQEYAGPDYKEMLYTVLGEVQLTSGRQWAATADEHGVQAALRALADTVPLLGKSPDQTSRLLALVRSAMSDTAMEWAPLIDGKLHPPQRTQCVPRYGEIVEIVEVSGVVYKASYPQHQGMSCTVPLMLHKHRVPAAKPPKSTPAVLKGDEVENF